MSSTSMPFASASTAAPAADRQRWLPATSWVLYDLANTVYAATVAYLLVPQITAGGARSMTAVGAVQTASMVLAGLLVPVLGAICDRTGRARSYLILTTSICIACLAAFSVTLETSLAATLACLFVANLCYQTALVFYNALLPSVARPERTGLVSGLGTGFGYVGTLLALMTMSAVMEPQPKFAALAALFFFFAIPCMLWVRERRVRESKPLDLQTTVDAFHGLRGTLRSLPQHRALLLFLLGNFLIVDVLNTAVIFFGALTVNLFADQYANGSLQILGIEFAHTGPGAPDLGKSSFLLMVAAALNLLAWVFGIGFGWLSDRCHPLDVLRVAAWCLAASLIGGAVYGGTSALGYMLTLVLFGAMGLAGIWTAGRKVLLSLAPPEKVGEFFGLYGVTMKLSVVGALSFGLVAEFASIKAALLAQLAPLVLGLGLLHAIKKGEES